MNALRPRGLVAAITYLAVAAVGTTAYWIVFFTSGAVHVQDDAAYLAFERAFPLADGWMATCAALATRAGGGVSATKRRQSL